MRRALPLILLLTASPAIAAPDQPDGLQVPADVLQEFKAIEELAAMASYPQAAERSEKLLPRLHDAPAARALLLRNLASLYGQQKHYVHAAHILEQAIGLNALAAGEAAKARLELGQYQAAAGDYSRAAGTLGEWLQANPSPQPEHFLWLADIRTRLKQYPQAAALVEKAIAAAPQPKSEWFQLLLGLHHESGNHDGCVRALLALIEREPDDPVHWSQLAGVYQEAGKGGHALAVQQVMYRQGLLKSPAAIVQLAQALRANGLYSRAAELLQQEVDKGGVAAEAQHLELLAGIWTEARELKRAAAALERAVATKESGDAYHRLGQIYSELHDWNRARQALSRALARGGLKNAGGAYLLLGLAHYRLDAKDQARAAFIKAQGAPATSQAAKQWLEHLDREAQRQRS